MVLPIKEAHLFFFPFSFLGDSPMELLGCILAEPPRLHGKAPF